MEGTVGVVATVEEEENVVMTDELIVRAPIFFLQSIGCGGLVDPIPCENNEGSDLQRLAWELHIALLIYTEVRVQDYNRIVYMKPTLCQDRIPT
jgi:hypothetical protein